MTGEIVLSFFATLFASTLFPTIFVMAKAISVTEWVLRIVDAAVLTVGIVLLKNSLILTHPYGSGFFVT